MRPLLLLLVACHAGRAPSATTMDVTWQSPVDIARGGGTKGPWQQNDSRFDYVDDPCVALAADGAAHVVWVDHRNKDVHYQVFAVDGSARTQPVNISNTPDVFSWLPRIVLAGGDDVFVLWQEIVFSGGTHGGEIFFARSRGGRFDAPVNLSQSIEGDGKARLDAETWHNGSLDLAVAPNGTLLAVWTNYEGTLWLASSTDGRGFTAPVRIAGTTERPARAPSLAVDAGAQRDAGAERDAGDAAVYLAWTVGETPSADILVAPLAIPIAAREPAARAAPVVVAKTHTYSDAPKVAFDARGTLHVAYAETTGGPFDRARIHYTRSRSSRTGSLGALGAFGVLGAFEPPRALGDGAFPSLAIDGDRVVVAWESPDNRSLEMTISVDRGAHFAKPSVIPHSRGEGINGSHQGRLMRKLAVRDGAITVVNSSLAHGEGSRVWLMRGRLR